MVGPDQCHGLLACGAALSRTAALRTSAAAAIDAVVAHLEASRFSMEADGSAGEPLEISLRSVPGHPEIVYSVLATPHPDELELHGGPVEYHADVDVSLGSACAPRPRGFTTAILRELPL